MASMVIPVGRDSFNAIQTHASDAIGIRKKIISPGFAVA